jgi:hypothetical protein
MRPMCIATQRLLAAYVRLTRKHRCRPRRLGFVMIALGFTLAALPAGRPLVDLDERPRTERAGDLGSYLARMDEAFARLGPSEAFVAHAVEAFPGVMSWGRMPGPVSVFDNWLLAAYGHAERLLVADRKTYIHARLRSHRYERAIARGTGFCGYLSLAFSDLMHRRYGFEAEIISLSRQGARGHIVSGVRLPDGRQRVVDPSEGLFLAASLDELERAPEKVAALYRGRRLAHVAQFFDPGGNTVHPLDEVSNATRRTEDLADVLARLIPVLMVLAGLAVRLVPGIHIADLPVDRLRGGRRAA